MRAVAEFIMRGRVQASAVAFAGAFLPLLTPVGLSAVGLVTLRKGLPDGVLALLCAIAAILIRGQSQLEMAAMIAPFAILWVTSIVLRATGSWATSLLLVTGLSLLFWWVVANALATQQSLMDQLLLQPLETLGGEQLEISTVFGGRELSDSDFAASLAVTSALGVSMCLLLARWWQAMLYNPGGLRAEFYALRFSRVQSLVLVGAILACAMAGEHHLPPWINVLALPLLIAAVSLVHWLVAERQLGTQALVLFYLGLVALAPLVIPVLLVIAFTDSIVDLRRYLSKAHRN